MKIKLKAKTFFTFVCIGASVFYLSSTAFNSKDSTKEVVKSNAKNTITEKKPEYLFNLRADTFQVVEHKINKNEFLSTILSRYNISPSRVSELAKISKPVFDVRKMSVGKPYTTFASLDNPSELAFFVYQPNPIDYIVYDLRDSIKVYAEQKEVETKIETIAGTINNSLYQALQESGSNPDIAIPLSEIFGGVVNFYSIQEGDWFKIKYEKKYVDQEVVGQGRIQSAIFSHKGKEFEAHYFQPDDGSDPGYYDENGNSLRRAFLKAPLKYSRISSRFSGRRLHPVQKVWKAHLGTDFAAPHGTPIVSTANGVVVESAFGRGNGNYVKIKHNKTYTTQYLHMSKRAVKKGQRVQQGQVIGYVGSTGLATGPHVCYRFWENGRQVDPLRKNFKSSEPLDSKYKAEFASLVISQQFDLAKVNQEDGKVIKEKDYTAYQDVPPELSKYFGKI